MKSSTRNAGVIAALTLLASLAAAGSSVLTSTNGMTVYTCDHDVPGSGDSTCVDACAATWAPVPVHAMPAGRDISTLRGDRDEFCHSVQWEQPARCAADIEAFAHVAP